MMNRNMWIASVIVGVTMGVAGAAHAGQSLNSSVRINAEQRYARGALSAARNSSDPHQMIGCTVTRDAGNSEYAWTSCWANDSTGASFACQSNSLAIADLAGSIGPASWIIFYADENGDCEWLSVENNSVNLPATAR